MRKNEGQSIKEMGKVGGGGEGERNGVGTSIGIGKTTVLRIISSDMSR